MSTGLRKLLVAGVVLLAIGAALTLRLNSDKISQHFYRQLQHATAAQFGAEHTELTFMHGFGLHLDTVVITHKQYQLRAKHVNISLRLLPLLLGNIQADSLDIHDADIIIQPALMTPTSTAISSLPVTRIRFVRSRIQTAAGDTILDNLYLEMRNIGPDSETFWELNARQAKQVLSGNGRLRFQSGQIRHGFSKLKMEHFQLSRLQAFAPHAFISWLQSEGSLLSGAVTLDISQQQTWALFGEVGLEREHQNAEPAGSNQPATVLKLRGKLSHPRDGALVWRDSFIHIGKQAVISIDGLCQQHDCNTTLDAKQVPLSEWAAFMPAGIAFYDHLSGMSDLDASIQWNEKQWQGKIGLQLTDASFNHGADNIQLPALHLKAEDLSGNGSQWHAQATITSPDSEGSILLRNEQLSNGNKDLYIDSHDADAELWQPLSNMVLSTLDIAPALQATGKIQGKLHLHQHGKKQSLSLDMDATQTQLTYASWLNKPEQVEAMCKARLDLSGTHITGVSIQQCRIDASSVDALDWSRRKTSRKLSVNKLSVDKLSVEKLDLDIKQFSKLLPENYQGLTGRVQGGGKTAWKEDQSWFNNMSGQWLLEDVATDTWKVNGAVDVKKGVFSSHPLLINDAYGKAKLSGFFEPARKRGDIDIIAGQLDWNSEPELNDFWKQLTIKGRIYQARLGFLDNDWQQIQSFYTFSHGQLKLNELTSRIADGQFSSQKLTLAPASGGIDIQGDIRGKNIQLRKLSRLHRWFGAAISGKLQANITVHGRIGQKNLADWQYSNGDMLIYDGGWKQQQQPELTDGDAVNTSLALQSFAFRKLNFRFRIGKESADISNISMLHLKQAWQGSAMITPELHLTGTMHNTADKSIYAIDSTLPMIH